MRRTCEERHVVKSMRYMGTQYYGQVSHIIRLLLHNYQVYIFLLSGHHNDIAAVSIEN